MKAPAVTSPRLDEAEERAALRQLDLRERLRARQRLRRRQPRAVARRRGRLAVEPVDVQPTRDVVAIEVEVARLRVDERRLGRPRVGVREAVEAELAHALAGDLGAAERDAG